MPELWLILASFLTSTLTAIIGMGGGLMLLALMPGFIPIGAVVPVHGVVQLASNATRAALAWRAIVRGIAFPFAIGAVLGAALGAPIAGRLPEASIGPILGAFVLVMTWWTVARPRRAVGDPPRAHEHSRVGYGVLGLAQSFISLFVGATGPLNAPFLARAELGRDRTVVTHAAMMTAVHLTKIVAFGFIGFSFVPYIGVTLGMIVAAVLGSWVGTRLRPFMPEHTFRWVFRIAITALAIRLIIR